MVNGTSFEKLKTILENKYGISAKKHTIDTFDVYLPEKAKWSKGLDVTFWNDRGFDISEWELSTIYEDLEDFNVFSSYINSNSTYQILSDEHRLEFDSLEKAVEKLEEFVETEMKKRGLL